MLNYNNIQLGDIQLLERIADLCDEASETIPETNENIQILNACDELVSLIDTYVEWLTEGGK